MSGESRKRAGGGNGAGGGGGGGGFSESDQEAIANKFQKLADDRKGRTGLGFSAPVAAAATVTSTATASISSIGTDTTATSASTHVFSKEDKTKHLKDSIHAIEVNSSAAALHRRQAIAQIQGSSDSLSSIDSTAPLSQQDSQHYAAIFSSNGQEAGSGNVSNTLLTAQGGKQEDSSQVSFFNRKVVSSTSADAPLYKRLKLGDTVFAYYAGDDQYHKAVIMSVMHGGYHSAKYDVKFNGYDSKETLSWTDLKPYSDYREEEKVLATGPDIGQVDAFGRSVSSRSEVPYDTSGGTNSTNLDSITMANTTASENFMENMMGSNYNKQAAVDENSMDVDVKGFAFDGNDSTVYESPISALEFSLSDIVDPNFFVNSKKGQWRNVIRHD